MTDSMIQLQDFIEGHGSIPQRWVVGVTSRPEKKLFQDHLVNRKYDSWIYRLADSPEAAIKVRDALVAFGCQADLDSSENGATIVYVYLKSPVTRP